MDAPAGRTQALEGLGTGDLVHEVAVDIKEGGAIRELLDDMIFPDLVE
jgi:hypothetical protein